MNWYKNKDEKEVKKQQYYRFISIVYFHIWNCTVMPKSMWYSLAPGKKTGPLINLTVHFQFFYFHFEKMYLPAGILFILIPTTTSRPNFVFKASHDQSCYILFFMPANRTKTNSHLPASTLSFILMDRCPSKSSPGCSIAAQMPGNSQTDWSSIWRAPTCSHNW